MCIVLYCYSYVNTIGRTFLVREIVNKKKKKKKNTLSKSCGWITIHANSWYSDNRKDLVFSLDTLVQLLLYTWPIPHAFRDRPT